MVSREAMCRIAPLPTSGKAASSWGRFLSAYLCIAGTGCYFVDLPIVLHSFVEAHNLEDQTSSFIFAAGHVLSLLAGDGRDLLITPASRHMVIALLVFGAPVWTLLLGSLSPGSPLPAYAFLWSLSTCCATGIQGIVRGTMLSEGAGDVSRWQLQTCLLSVAGVADAMGRLLLAPLQILGWKSIFRASALLPLILCMPLCLVMFFQRDPSSGSEDASPKSTRSVSLDEGVGFHVDWDEEENEGMDEGELIYLARPLMPSGLVPPAMEQDGSQRILEPCSDTSWYAFGCVFAVLNGTWVVFVDYGASFLAKCSCHHNLFAHDFGFSMSECLLHPDTLVRATVASSALSLAGAAAAFIAGLFLEKLSVRRRICVLVAAIAVLSLELMLLSVYGVNMPLHAGAGVLALVGFLVIAMLKVMQDIAADMSAPGKTSSALPSLGVSSQVGATVLLLIKGSCQEWTVMFASLAGLHASALVLVVAFLLAGTSEWSGESIPGKDGCGECQFKGQSGDGQLYRNAGGAPPRCSGGAGYGGRDFVEHAAKNAAECLSVIA